MVYLVKNVSDNNIFIGKEKLRPDKEKTVVGKEEIKKYISLLQKKYITITRLDENDDELDDIFLLTQPIIEEKKLTVENKAESNSNKDFSEVLDNNFIKENLKQNLIESFFNYYLVKDLTTKELNLLKWFYKNVGYTNCISKETLSLLDDVQDEESLTEVLLNNIYPEMLDNYLAKENQEKNNPMQ